MLNSTRQFPSEIIARRDPENEYIYCLSSAALLRVEIKVKGGGDVVGLPRLEMQVLAASTMNEAMAARRPRESRQSIP